ncbi:unnamed protein product [Orchesella dallaii]|uniref:Uncharacterized protein n=1 Tax=Orchesella dallaii TaxID=48710 RepID=A0ABP1S833_9HEXA
MSGFAKAVKAYASKYDGFKVHSFEGLNDFLNPVQHCFIHMTNFGGVELPSLNVPSIQMKTKLAVYSQRICVEINFRKFVTKIRPWTCEVVVSLFQKQVTLPKSNVRSFYKDIQHQNIVIPFAQNHVSLLRYIDRLLPSFAPINIFVTEKQDASVCPQNWDLPSSFVLTTPTDLKARLTTLNNNVFKINTVFSLQAIPAPQDIEIHCVNFGNILQQESDLNVKQKYSALSNMFEAGSIHNYNSISFDQVDIPETFIHESVCRNNYLKWATKSLHSSDKAYSVSIMGEWLQILRRYNYTILLAGEIVSCNLRDYTLKLTDYLPVQLSPTLIHLENTIYPTAVSHPLAIDDPNHKLGFIACGSRSMDYFAFRELLWVFDSYVWMCLGIIYLTIVPITICTMIWLSENNILKTNSQHAARSNVFSSRIFLQPITILLEQGDAFTNKHLNVAAIRWVAAALILVAIVLSNSYKYDNVYNMMLPRKATPLWFFQQILSANFTAYTRTNFFNQLRRDLVLVSKETSLLNDNGPSDHTITLIDENSNLQTINSEVENIFLFELIPLYKLHTTLVNSWHTKNNLSNRSQRLRLFIEDLYDKLHGNTKLHPYEKELAKKLRHKYIMATEHHDKFKKAHESGQTYYISHLINECNNTAIVLPLSVIRRLLPAIQNQGHSKFSIGMEVLVERVIGMALNGWISDHLITTLSRIIDAGLWQHIRNIFVRNITTTFEGTRNSGYQTSQISGNILVVFVTYLCGHVVAAVSFIFEIRKRIYVWVLVLKKSIYLGIEKLWSKITCLQASVG